MNQALAGTQLSLVEFSLANGPFLIVKYGLQILNGAKGVQILVQSWTVLVHTQYIVFNTVYKNFILHCTVT